MESPYSSDYEDLAMEDNHDSRVVFKSKNLDAERRRRAKLNERLLQLRAIVPIITNMTKAYIIKDAITYIEELDGQVSELKDELMELGNSTPPKEETKPTVVKDEKNATAQEMTKNYAIEPEVKVVPIDDNKLWIKVVYENKMGGFSKLVEIITRLGLEFNDTNLTTSNGAAVISSCLEGMTDGCLQVEKATELIMSVISSL